MRRRFPLAHILLHSTIRFTILILLFGPVRIAAFRFIAHEAVTLLASQHLRSLPIYLRALIALLRPL